MKMLRNNILVEKLSKEQRGAILMPDNVKDDWQRGKVVGIGSGTTMFGNKVEMEVEVGDIIVFPPSPYGSYPTIIVDGYERIILTEDAVWAVENK